MSLVCAVQRRKKARDEESCPGGASAVQATRLRRRLPLPDVVSAIRIAFEKDVGLLLLFMSLFVMANYTILVPLQDIIRLRHDFNDLQVGLCYIPFACGSVAGAVLMAKMLNWNYVRIAKSIGVSADRKRGDDLRKFPIERARLGLLWPWVALAVASTVSWGWVVNANVNLAAPLVLLFLSGFSLSGPVSTLSTLLVDLYPMNPGRVSSTFNLTRATFSAVGTAIVQYIIEAWGYGFTYVFVGLLVAAASPAVYITQRWGPKWREERYQRLERKRPS